MNQLDFTRSRLSLDLRAFSAKILRMQKQNIISLLAAVLLAAGLGVAPPQQVWAQSQSGGYAVAVESRLTAEKLSLMAEQRKKLIEDLQKKKSEVCLTDACAEKRNAEAASIQSQLDMQARVDIKPLFSAFQANAQDPAKDVEVLATEIARLKQLADDEQKKLSGSQLAMAETRCQQTKLPEEFQAPANNIKIEVFRVQVLEKTIKINQELEQCIQERELKRLQKCGNRAACMIREDRQTVAIDDYLAPTDNYIRMLNTQLGSFKAATEQAKTLQLGGPDGLLVVPGQQFFSSPANFLVAATTLALRLIGLLAFVVIIFAGFRLLISAGDDSAITRSKEMIKMAAIGLAVALMAYIIVSVVQGILYA